MKRMRHNKKRNTLFLFEVLVHEMTKCITSKDDERKSVVLSILKEFFRPGSELRKEKELLHGVITCTWKDTNNIQKLIFHTREEYSNLNSDSIFESQSALIKRVNKELGPDLFKTFLKDYKRIATVHQLFNAELTPKQRVLIEQNVVEQKIEEKEEIVHIDKLVYTKFVEGFNSKYAGKLHEEQSQLLSHYISSFTDNGVQLKVFVNEEISRILSRLQNSLEGYEIQENSDLELGINQVISNVKNYRNQPINENMLKDIINLQQLVRELTSNGD